jgi:hypothetical protein
VVDDLAYNTDALIYILEACGLEVARQVHTAMNGRQAVK